MLESGFTGAPVSKLLAGFIIASSVLANVTETRYVFPFRLDPKFWSSGMDVSQLRGLWRVLIWEICYTNNSELLFAATTIYHMRVIERLWGPRKFTSFILTTYLTTSVLTPLLTLSILRPLFLNTISYLPSGPTPVLFALLAQYYSAIPQISKTQISTTTASSASSSSSSSREVSREEQANAHLIWSDKSLVYLLASQLALAQVPGSLVAAVMGWVVGLMWRGGRGFSGWRVPSWVVS
ncbi:hypothetical protein MMC25_005877 [Agyrium rufum]|nr:hypothetical protein [Agyrium rufum]